MVARFFYSAGKHLYFPPGLRPIARPGFYLLMPALCRLAPFRHRITFRPLGSNDADGRLFPSVPHFKAVPRSFPVSDQLPACGDHIDRAGAHNPLFRLIQIELSQANGQETLLYNVYAGEV